MLKFLLLVRNKIHTCSVIKMKSVFKNYVNAFPGNSFSIGSLALTLSFSRDTLLSKKLMANNINVRRQTKELVTIISDKNNEREHDLIRDTPVISNPWKSAISISGVSKCSAFVDDLEDQLVNHIITYGQNSLAVGCIAWFSNPRIIAALARHCKAVLILVNDENYAVWGGGKCLSLYTQLPALKEPMSVVFDHMNTPLRGIPGENSYKPVRCIRNTGDALMHDKFLVFFKPVAIERLRHHENGSQSTEIVWRDVPAAVWTGSMNMTKKASRNQENAVFIESELMATFYFNNFVNSFLHSAPLRTTGDSSSGAVNDDKPLNFGSPSIPNHYRPYVKQVVAQKRNSENFKPRRMSSTPKKTSKKPLSTTQRLNKEKEKSNSRKKKK